MALDLDELEKLEAAATPGEWHGLMRVRPEQDGIATIRTGSADPEAGRTYVPFTAEDARFTIAARAAWPALIREARALRLVHRWCSNVAYNFSQFPDRTQREDAMPRAFQDIEAKVKEALGDGR